MPRVGHGLLAVGLALLVAGATAAYFLNHYPNISAPVFSRALVVPSPTLLKIDYVACSSALFRMRRLGQEVCCVSA